MTVLYVTLGIIGLVLVVGGTICVRRTARNLDNKAKQDEVSRQVRRLGN